MPKKNSNNNLINDNREIFNTVSIVDGDEVVNRSNDEYIYLDAVGGLITQPSEIATVQNRQSVDVLKNQLLGQFNTKTGKYEISNNIELELQQIVKVETSWVGNATFVESLSSFGGLGKLKFVVKTSVKNGEAHSELYIFERVNKMAKTVANTQIQLVGEFKRTNENYVNFESLSFENYFRFAWEHFKIVKLNQSFYMSEDERFLQGWIVRRKLYLQNMDERLDASIELAESGLLLERIEILSGLGEYGYKVLGRFEELKNQATKIVRGEELSARDQNEILEEAVETFRGKYVKEQEQFFDKQVKSVENYTQTISNLKEQNHKQVLNDIEMRMPTVVEVIKREDERRIEDERIKQAVKEAKAQANGEPQKVEPAKQKSPEQTPEQKQQKKEVPKAKTVDKPATSKPLPKPTEPVPVKFEKPPEINIKPVQSTATPYVSPTITPVSDSLSKGKDLQQQTIQAAEKVEQKVAETDLKMRLGSGKNGSQNLKPLNYHLNSSADKVNNELNQTENITLGREVERKEPGEIHLGTIKK